MPDPFGWEKKGSNPFLISYYSEEGNYKHTAGTWEWKTGDIAYGIMGGETSSAADIPLSVVQQMGERQFGVRPLRPDGIRAGTSTRDPTYGDNALARIRDYDRAGQAPDVETAGGNPWGVTKAELKSLTDNKKLLAIIETNYGKYDDGSRIGNGDTGIALIMEKLTGVNLSDSGHEIKAYDLRRRINNFIRSEKPIALDLYVANIQLQNIEYAIRFPRVRR